MSVKENFNAYLLLLLKWLALLLIVSVAAGTLSAIFLNLLNRATIYREQHQYLLYLLPIGGLGVGLLYHYFGSGTDRGNNLVFDTIHNPKDIIPFRMVPLVLFSTIITHLFGGSAGREGTALQMSAAAADQLRGPFRLSASDRTILLIAGLSAGFASVFGTPLSGAVFGLEVLLLGKAPYKAIIPAIMTAFLAAQVTALWGIGHTHYHIDLVPAITPAGLFCCALAGTAFGTAAIAFVKLTRLLSKTFKKIHYAPLRPLAGGIVFVLLVLLLGTNEYNGLGIPSILQSFETAAATTDFALKVLLTSITLGAGFKGGEVTPLFFIGATLGSTLSLFLPLPVGLLAGMGFVAVFAGAAKTPVACCIMAIELFGVSCSMHIVIACTVSYLLSDSYSIYNASSNKEPEHFLFGKFRKPFL